jgi:hypothetical protein
MTDYLLNKAKADQGGNLAGLLLGRRIDIVSGDDGQTLLTAVPKQMLFYFCGYQNIASKILAKDDGTQTLQLLPRSCEYIGLKIVVA